MRRGRSIVFLMMIGLLLSGRIGSAQETPFVYDDHGRRDPFESLISSTGAIIMYDTELSANDLILEGVLADQGGNMAIINGLVVQEGDAVGGFYVDRIEPKIVTLLKDGKAYKIRLKASVE